MEEGYTEAANAGGEEECAFGAAIYASRAIFTFGERYAPSARAILFENSFRHGFAVPPPS